MSEYPTLETTMPREKWVSKEQYVVYLKQFAAYKLISQRASGKKVLEIGCGTGYGSVYLSSMSANMTAIDINPDAISFCQRKYKQTKVNFMLTDGDILPFEDSQFDMVISFQVIEHLQPDRLESFLRQIARVLRKEGEFWVSTPNARMRLLPFQKPWNLEHKKEYKSEELKKVLNLVFEKTDMYGLCASEAITAVERKRVKQNPVNIYLLFPAFHFFNSLFRNTIHRKSIENNNLEQHIPDAILSGQFNLPEFRFDSTCPKKSLDLIGLCSK